MKKIVVTAILTFAVLTSCKKSNEEIAALQAQKTDIAFNFFKKTKISDADLDSFKKNFPTKEKDTVAYYKDRVTDIFNDGDSQSYLRIFYTDASRKTVSSVFYFAGDRNVFAQEYYDNGQARCTFETEISGARQGYAYCFDENGKKTKQTYYKNDSEVKDSLKIFTTPAADSK